MEQTILEYHESAGGAYWTGTVLGKEMKFVRVIAGLAIPQLDRQDAAVVIIGELHRSSEPPDFTGLGAGVGSLAEVKRELVQFCHSVKPSHIVVGDEPSRKLVFPLTDALIGLKPLPLCYAAPAHSVGETGRQLVQELLDEERLHIAHLLSILDRSRDQSDHALRFAVNYALEFSSFYTGKKRKPLAPKLFGTAGL